MRRLAIEINDAGLIVADESGIVRSEPGYAVVDGRQILTGDEAFALARLKPRATSLSHWGNLSIEPGSAGLTGNRSTAELAHAQLDKLWRRCGGNADQVVLVVPGTMSGDSLGVLLGLAEECGLPVTALVDAAAAASVQPWPERQLVYVDADLHGVTVTPLEQGDRVTAQTPAYLDSMGLAGFADACARRIAELFVFATRFDPFHDARTEQQLYDGLGVAMASLDREGKARFSIVDGGESFEVDIERADLVAAVHGFYRAVRQLIAQSRQAQAGLVVQLSDRLAGLPGLEEELARLDEAAFVPLVHGHAARAVLAIADSFGRGDGGVRFFRHLPWRAAPAAAPQVADPNPAAARVVSPEARPTHVVYRGIAYPVNGEGIVIGRSKLDQRRAILIESRAEGVSRAHCELMVVDGELRLRDLSSFGTFVNDRRIDGEEILKPADIIRVGSPGAELTVVRVEDGDAT